MTVYKILVKGTFFGGVVGALIGLFGGAVIGLVVWPTSNLAPLAGFLYGLPIGICVGAVVGFITGLLRVRAAKRSVDEI